ncbi:MAG: hypothetical protein HZB26_05290 [Candidatus Hydrogenedentes bacterium]|nr:hypothetical protein [Candidatus Hydrogenedentota bacterium]
MTKQCCVCKKVNTGATWITVAYPESAAAHASHGYCPTCAAVAFAEVEQFAAERDILRTVVSQASPSRELWPST